MSHASITDTSSCPRGTNTTNRRRCLTGLFETFDENKELLEFIYDDDLKFVISLKLNLLIIKIIFPF